MELVVYSILTAAFVGLLIWLNRGIMWKRWLDGKPPTGNSSLQCALAGNSRWRIRRISTVLLLLLVLAAGLVLLYRGVKRKCSRLMNRGR